jgi:tRNA dimethylallyltransferase
MCSQPARPVVVVTGPTAAGKTGLAIEVARRFAGEVVNADSMQVFRYLDIGTAKPTLEERSQVPHHLFDIVTPDIAYSAGRYSREARQAAGEIHARGHLVVLAGGTGLYIRAFLEGLLPSGSADRELRDRLEREHQQAVEEGAPQRLYERLAALDPEAAERIHPNDLRRVTRALEIVEQLGAAASTARDDHGFRDRPFETLHLAIDPGRETLHQRIDRRCQAMIDAGLLREVRDLRARRYGPELRPLHAIGYRHIGPVVDGLDTLANALPAMQRDTRRFAKRQRTWLRGISSAEWMRPDDPDAIYRRVEAFLEPTGETQTGPDT